MTDLFRAATYPKAPADPLYFITDPGHGGLRVPVSLVRKVGLRPEDFSGYSYTDHGRATLFLEEDCDCPLFLSAYRKTYGIGPRIIEKHDETGLAVRSQPVIRWGFPVSLTRSEIEERR